MKRASGWVISGEKLSSGFDNLKQHKKRVNYQAVSSPVWLLKEIQSQNLFLLRHRLAMSRWLSHSRVWKYMQEDFQNRALREKCPNKEFFLVLIFPHLDWIWTRKKLRIWILFTQWRLGCIWQRRWWSTAFYFWNDKLRDNFKDKILKLYLICSHKWILDMIFYRHEWQFTDQDI